MGFEDGGDTVIGTLKKAVQQINQRLTHVERTMPNGDGINAYLAGMDSGIATMRRHHDDLRYQHANTPN